MFSDGTINGIMSLFISVLTILLLLGLMSFASELLAIGSEIGDVTIESLFDFYINHGEGHLVKLVTSVQ